MNFVCLHGNSSIKKQVIQAMKNISVLFVFLLTFPRFAGSQTTPSDPSKSGGGWARIELENGDTIYVATLRGVSIRGNRTFPSKDDQHRYYFYKRCAQKVYPYAVEAVKLYTDLKEETADMNRRKRKKYVKENQGELTDQYEDQLKNLTKTQGKILIKMIERYTGDPFHSIIKQTRGGFTAMYWSGLGRIWGYDLKEGYQPGDDPILDAVLTDFDLGLSLGND